ncbi:MAG: amino acid permease [Acidobacteriia bacterium]|nr:amino acid permease [Terriglobia bacterium]
MPQLTRTLGFRDLTLITIGSVIGSGIFLVPGPVIRQVGGSMGVALMVWLVGGILSLLGALTYGELSAMNPSAGGLYVYIRDCFGKFFAFMFGWTLFFVTSSGTNATLAVAFSAYLGEIVPLTPVMAKLIAAAMLLVVMAVNVWGTRRSADLTNWTTAVKVAAILGMSIALMWLGHGFVGSRPYLWPLHFSWPLASGFGVAMVSVLWAYEGWQFGTYSAAETLHPQRDFPRSLTIGTGALIGLYMLANVAYLAGIGPVAVARSDSVAAASMAAIFTPAAAKLVALAILISIFSATNVTVLTATRVYYAMASDGIFFKRLAEVHPRFGTPAFAIVTSSVWSIVLALSGTFEQLLTYVIFIAWIFYALAAASIFVYRRRQPNASRPYRVPGYPWTPLLFILAAAALVGNTIFAEPLNALVGLGIVLLGAPAYLIWQSRSKKAKAVIPSP